MKKRDRRQQAKLDNISKKRAQYVKARKQKIALAKNKSQVPQGIT